MAIEVNGKSLETDEEGYLANLNDWEKDVATVMAKEDDIDLSEDHWEIINFLREYYEEYQIAPASWCNLILFIVFTKEVYNFPVIL